MYSVNPISKKKEDAHLHGPILAGGAKHALMERQSARERAGTLHNLTDAELDRAYGRNSRIKQRASGGRVENSKIDNSYDVRSGAVSNKDPNGPIYIDPHIPEFSPKLTQANGKPARLWKYLAVHETKERKAMADGMPYLEAHEKVATPAERAAVQADGVDWEAYTKEIDGYLASIEHEKVKNPPPNPHVDPNVAVGHHRSENKVRQRAAGGRVLASNINHFPSEAQKASGTYAKDHVNIQGLAITIENAKGSYRSGTSEGGVRWRCKLASHYGYLKKTEGSDGDHIDVYLGPYTKSKNVFLIDQINADTKKFDEHKICIGFPTLKLALQSYVKCFSDGKGHDRIGAIVEMPMEKFKQWLTKADTSKPVSMDQKF